MAFWSSQTLTARMSELIVGEGSSATVDCNSITLTVGPEVYITPSLADHANYTHTKKALAAKEAFAIPPGQFAFLLTEETVYVPPSAMAFISMKASFKLRGLVNVSGFHVDPGWTGRLIFAVFNAGPSPVHLQRGLPLFLIWYADLDQPSEAHKTGKGLDDIPPTMINNITGAVDSLYALEKRLTDETKKLDDRIHEIDKKQGTTQTLLAILSMIVVGLLSATVTSHYKIDFWKSSDGSIAVQAPPLSLPAAGKPIAPVDQAVPATPDQGSPKTSK